MSFLQVGAGLYNIAIPQDVAVTTEFAPDSDSPPSYSEGSSQSLQKCSGDWKVKTKNPACFSN